LVLYIYIIIKLLLNQEVGSKIFVFLSNSILTNISEIKLDLSKKTVSEICPSEINLIK
jgi:hypothetical protein